MGYNSTIISKKKNLSCGHFDYAFSKGRCKQCATIEDALKRINEAEEKDENLSDLIKECDDLFSKYIRLKYADKDGNVKCYTCDIVKPIAEMQCGHYKSRMVMFLRLDERNARPQCKNCNEYKKGNLAIYGKKLEIDSPGITEILEEEMRTIYKYTREELRQLKFDLMRKLKI